MPLLISSDDLVEIIIRYEEKQNKLFFYEEDREGLSVESFWFKRPDWGDQKLITEGTLSIDSNGIPIMDPYRYQDMKFKVLLKKWTLKNKDGDVVPVTHKFIDQMHPLLIKYIQTKLDPLLFEDIEEAKKEVEDRDGGIQSNGSGNQEDRTEKAVGQ